MPRGNLPRILMVDDEPRILEAHQRNLRFYFNIVTATSGSMGLEALARDGPFAVAVSDLRMPEMDGVAFLRLVHEREPDTVRVLFTGHPDLESAIASVNDGAIFRFLTKPCPPEFLRQAIDLAVRQNQLITSERVLLEQTLHGSVKALTEVLAMVSPVAFGRAARVCQTVKELQQAFSVPVRWPAEVAAMLSQLGCVTLPPRALEKFYRGDVLEAGEQAMIDRLPSLVEGILANIPRIDQVREILRYQARHFDGTGAPHDGVSGEAIPWGARALRIALDLDVLESQDLPAAEVFSTLNGREGRYDPVMLHTLMQLRGGESGAAQLVIKELPLEDLKRGMVLLDDIKTIKGLLLVPHGQEVTHSMIERLRNFSVEMGVRQPIRVSIPAQVHKFEGNAKTSGISRLL